MVAVDPRARFIVAQSFFQQRNELLHRLNGKASVFAEGQRQQRLVKLRWNTGLPQRRYALRVAFTLRQDGGNGIELLLGQGADRALAHLVQRRPHLVIGLHLRPLALLRFLFRFLAVIETVKEHIIIQIQFLADLPVTQRCRTERRAFQRFTLRGIQRLRRHAHTGQAHAAQVLQKLEILKCVGRLCRSLLIRLEGAGTHPFPDAAGKGAVPAGAFVKAALTLQNGEIGGLHILVHPDRAQPSLGGEDLPHLVHDGRALHGEPVILRLIASLVIVRAVRMFLPEPLIPIHHLAYRAVAVLGHAAAIFFDGSLDLPCLLFVLRRLRGAVGLVAAPLGKMDQHPNRFLLGERAVQCLGAQLVGRFWEATGGIHGLYICNRHDAALLHQVTDAFQTVPMAAQAAPGASCVPPGGRKAGAGFWLLRLVKNTHAQVLDPVRLSVRLISEDCPADRTNAYVQSKRIMKFRHLRGLLS